MLGWRVALREFEKDPLLFTSSPRFSLVDWLRLRNDLVSRPPSGWSDTRLFRTFPMKFICSGSPQFAAIDSISTMFQRFRMATVVALVALNSNSITLDELLPGLRGGGGGGGGREEEEEGEGGGGELFNSSMKQIRKNARYIQSVYVHVYTSFSCVYTH